MSRNDGFFKILFAIELALIPMVIFAHLYLETWAMALIIGALAITKLWREIFKDKESRSHSIISILASLCEFCVLITYFAVEDLLLFPLAIVAVIIMILFNVLKFVFANVNINETIQAVDVCMIVFELLTLVAFAIMSFVEEIEIVALWTLVLAGGVSVIYKIYYGFKYANWGGKIKGIFRRK